MHVFDISQQNHVTENFLVLQNCREDKSDCLLGESKTARSFKEKNASTINTCHFKIHIENKLNTK